MKKNVKDRYKKNACHTKAGVVFYKKNIGKLLSRGIACIGSTNTF